MLKIQEREICAPSPWIQLWCDILSKEGARLLLFLNVTHEADWCCGWFLQVLVLSSWLKNWFKVMQSLTFYNFSSEGKIFTITAAINRFCSWTPMSCLPSVRLTLQSSGLTLADEPASWWHSCVKFTRSTWRHHFSTGLCALRWRGRTSSASISSMSRTRAAVMLCWCKEDWTHHVHRRTCILAQIICCRGWQLFMFLE